MTVDTTIASTASAASTQTTVTVTIPEDTTIQSSGSTTTTDEDGNETTSATTITSLTLKVKQVYSADSTDILNDTSYAVGDYTFDISLVDQDGNTVSATSGYIEIAIQAAAGVTNRKVYHDGEALSTSAANDGDTYYTYKSGTGVFTIYTQSFSEYEICWRGKTGTTISTAYLQGSYDDESTSTQTSTATVTTTLANSESDEDNYTTTTTFKASVTSDTEITSSTGEITSLYPVVTETTSETTAVVPGGDAGDYTFESSLIDQDAAEVTATEGYIVVTIAAKTGMSNMTVTKIEDDGTETTLGTKKTSDGSDYYKYNSTTGALKIYTQSLGEYEIWWNDTEISMKEITDELLTFTGKNSKTYTMDIGWMYYTNAESINDAYSSWNINIAILPDNDMSDATIHYTSDIYKYSSSLYLYYTYGVLNGRPSDILTAGSDYCLFSGDYIYPASYLVASEEGVNLFDYNFRVGLKGCPAGTGTVELRLYETDDDGKETGKYITLQTLSLKVTESD